MLVLMMLLVGEGDELLTVKNYWSIFNRQKLFQKLQEINHE